VQFSDSSTRWFGSQTAVYGGLPPVTCISKTGMTVDRQDGLHVLHMVLFPRWVVQLKSLLLCMCVQLHIGAHYQLSTLVFHLLCALFKPA
jgi:hypothetical protein